MAAVPVGGGGDWPGFEATRRATSATRRHWCGEHRRDPWAWPRCPWAAAGPGRASRRRAEQHQRPGATGVEGTGETRGPGCGARGRRGLAGFRGDAPSNISNLAPQVWRAPEGSAAVPVGGGGAWPGFEATRRAKLAARTASGRAAAHRHTQRPGPPAPGTPAAPQATKQRKRAAAHRAAARSRSQWSTQRRREATTSATWTAFRAAPLRRLSPETTRTRPRLPSTAWS